MITSGADLNAAIQIELSHGPNRMFRFNAGVAWQGRIVEHTQQRLVMMYPRAIKLACEGFSDLAGWAQEGGRAIFTAIESKYGKDRLTAEQRAFIDLVNRSGGRAGVAHSVDEAAAIMYGRPLPLKTKR